MACVDRAMKVHQAQRCVYALATKFITLLLLCYHNSECRTLQENSFELLDEVLTALERTSAFFAKDYSSLNLDGMFGIRLCQGSIGETLKDCSSSKFRCPTDLVKRVERILSQLSETAETALPYIENNDPRYFSMFLPTIDAPYVVQYVDERLGDDAGEPGFDTTYDETKGDHCFANLMGTFSKNDIFTPKCTVSNECWEYMTRRNTAAYAITHELLYLILGEKTGCLREIQKYLGKGNATVIRDVQRDICRKIYAEAKNEENNGSVAVLSQDLFLEQSVLCAILGFQDFVRANWIRMVLGWQTAEGCFAMPHGLVAVQDELNDVQESQRQLIELLNEEARLIDQNYPSRKGRQLMREKSMNGDCLAHKTGLGVGTLGAYTRQLIRRLYND
ncbi:hypothetical protein BsWGS_21813 [Bradybaena similaris]